MREGSEELLWAPDSKAFFVNGAESAYAGFFVTVYQLRDNGVSILSLTGTAQRDMVASFPPCKAVSRDPRTCKQIVAHPEYNMSGIAWADGSAAIIVMAEVPCSSSYGGIMCQVLGYKLQVPTGKIIRRMTAQKLKAEWQKSMAWNMRIPEPAKVRASLGYAGSICVHWC